MELDLSGLTCPMPLIKFKKTLAQNPDVSEFVLILSDKGALNDIPSFCSQVGLSCALVASDEVIVFRIARVI